MMEAELFDGTVLEFPDGTSPEVIQRVVKEKTAERKGSAAAPPPAATPEASVEPAAVQQAQAPAPAPKSNGVVDAIMRGGNYAAGTGAVAAQEYRHGLGDMLGAPVDIVNNSPRLLNLLPGVDGFKPFTDRPYFGSEHINSVLDAPTTALAAATGNNAEVKPADAFQRIVGRGAREMGATTVPVAASLRAAKNFTPQTVRQVGGLTQFFVEPAVVNPAGLTAKEMTYAAGAGTGAGIANEIAGNPQKGDNFWSDFIGSILGTLGMATTGKVIGAGKNVYGAVTSNPRMMDEVAGQEVADRIINNSTMLGEQFARTGRVDTSPLVDVLRRKSRVEEAVPGYVANIGDRSQDPLLMTMVQNQDALAPGAANVRRTANEAAVNQRMADVAPNGDPAQFRAALEANRDAKIGQALSDADIARAAFDTAAQAVQPGLRDATARGSSIRSALVDVYNRERANVDSLYRPINEATVPVDAAPLRDRFAQIDESLPFNDRQRFRPAEADVPAKLLPEDGPTTVPLNEVTSMRSGLTDDIRANRAGGHPQAAYVGDKYRQAIDEFTEQAVPPELKGQLDTARAARRDVADRFERDGTAIGDSLRTREGGAYQLDDSAVPGRFAQPDNGRLSDLRSLLKEAGTDQRARDGLADEVLSDVQRRGLVDKPEQLGQYLQERSVLLGEFPELRAKLEQAGAARGALTAAEKNVSATTERLTNPSRSAQASYLKYGDEATVNAVRNLTAGPKPREAARELLAAAGDTPEARLNARAALWEVVKTKKLQAQGATGNERWDAKKLKAMFDDPKTNAVAEELWSDAPKDLSDIKELFGALAGAEGSIRTRQPGSSGTPAALAGKFDPSLSASSVASRVRSVNRGQLSPTIAVVDIASTWLRNRSKQVQSRAIDTLASAAFNNPGLAADLLEKFNPADYAARRQMILQKYGVRATQVINLMDEIHGQDDTTDAIMRK